MRRRALAAAVLIAAVAAGLPTNRASGERLVHHRVVIGHSVQGRPIRAVEIGDANASHTVLVVGCIHGNECAAMPVVDRLLRSSPPAGVDLWVVRSMNPDGRAAATRQNARGVDLNRNFPYKWRRHGYPWYAFYSGPRAASEPETRTAIRFIRDIHPEMTIWYHQHENAVIKCGGRPDVQRRYARLVGMRLYRHYPWSPGRATDWQNHRLDKTTAFVVELPAGSLGPVGTRRHTRAVLRVSSML